METATATAGRWYERASERAEVCDLVRTEHPAIVAALDSEGRWCVLRWSGAGRWDDPPADRSTDHAWERLATLARVPEGTREGEREHAAMVACTIARRERAADAIVERFRALACDASPAALLALVSREIGAALGMHPAAQRVHVEAIERARVRLGGR